MLHLYYYYYYNNKNEFFKMYFAFFITGVTNFDLLGDFGRMDWLRNFYIILLYNIIFAVATALCLVTTFTSKLRQELYLRLRMAFKRDRERRTTSSTMLNGDTSHMKDE